MIVLEFEVACSYTEDMKSYNQSCPIAQALDVIGDRWTLLVLRELLIQGPCRYTDLAQGLPGIATSVLADRLRSLEEAGLIRREAAPPPVATTLFHLTDAGRAVEPILIAIGRWGVEQLNRPGPDAEGRIHWFPFAASIFLRDQPGAELPVTVQLETPFGSGVVDVAEAGVTTRIGTDPAPDLTITGGPDAVIDLLSGKASIAEATSRGVTLTGDTEILPGVLHVTAS